jgi:hypothetical protein
MAGPFVNRFRSIVEALFARRFTGEDGISEAELQANQSRAGYELPEALQDFYMVAGRFEPVMGSHNRFYPPDRFSGRDGKRVFCEENQVVVYWGYEEDQGWRTDPPVYQGVNNEEVEWYAEAERCSDFLAGMIYWQALFGGLPEFRHGYAPDTVRETASKWPLVVQDGDSQLFSRGALVFTLTCRDSGFEVQAAGLSEVELEELWQALGLVTGRT